MNCIITFGTTGELRRENIPGVTNLYLTNLSSIADITPEAGATGVTPSDAGFITEIQLENDRFFHEIELERFNCEWTDAPTVNPQNSSVYFTPTLMFRIPKINVANRNLVNIIVRDRVVALVRNQDGTYWLLGEDKGLDVTEANAGTGRERDDYNGYEITLEGYSRFPVRQVQFDEGVFDLADLLEPIEV